MKSIIIAATLLALTLSVNTANGKKVLFECEKEYEDRNFTPVEATETTPPGATCPEVPGHCTITVIVYDDLTGDIELGELVIPFNEPNPSEPRAQMILNDVDLIIASGGIIYQDYQPNP